MILDISIVNHFWILCSIAMLKDPSLKLFMQIFVANASTKYKRDRKYQLAVFALCSPTWARLILLPQKIDHEHNNFLDHAIDFSPFQKGVIGINRCGKQKGWFKILPFTLLSFTLYPWKSAADSKQASVHNTMVREMGKTVFSVTSEHKIIYSRGRHASLSKDIILQNTRFHWSLLNLQGTLHYTNVVLHYSFHSTIENFSACCTTSRGIKLAASQASRIHSACSLAIRVGVSIW